MIRVLQCVNNMHRAGLETMLMNYYRNIDRTKIQFDFLTHRPERDDYDDEIENLGGRIFRAPRLYPQNYPAYFSYMKDFFREHPEYKIMHSHIDSMSYLPLLAGKKAGVPIRIAHSHSTSIDLDYKYILKQFYRTRILDVANYCCACGEEAANFLFGNNDFQIISNAVDAKRFLFDASLRDMKRKQLQIDDKFVIGHVGRISYPKNHKFLVEIFDQILKCDKNAVLLLVGVGEKEKEVRAQIDKLDISEHVYFLGNRDDVCELYQAMDVFVLPSLFEGVPVVGVEAQFSDLPCIFSNKVPKEVMFSDDCKFVDLGLSASCWAELILSLKNRKRGLKDISYTPYDMKYAHIILEKYYLELFAKTEL